MRVEGQPQAVVEARSRGRQPSSRSAAAGVERDPLHLAGARRRELGLEVLGAAELAERLGQLQHVGLDPGADVDRRRSPPTRPRPAPPRPRRPHICSRGSGCRRRRRSAARRRAAGRRRSRSRRPRRAGPGAGRRRCRAAGARRRARRAARRAPGSPRRRTCSGRRRTAARSARPRRAAAAGPRPRRRSRRRWRRRRPARAPAARAASSTLAVPPTLTAASKAGSSTDLRTSIWAARWKIDLGLRSARQRGQRGAVADVELDQLGAGRQRPVEVLAAAGREVVDDRHLVAAREQRVDQIRADEAGAAGDQSLHRASPILRGSASASRRSGRRRRAPLLPSPPDATDRHREEQQRQEDRRDPQRRRGDGSDKTFKVPFYTWTDAERRADDDRPQGPRARPRLPRGLLELAEDRPARPDRRRADQGADRQKRRQSDQESRQRGRRAGDRDRLRPRGRADRARGAGGDARRQPRARLPRGHRRRHACGSSAPATRR